MIKLVLPISHVDATLASSLAQRFAAHNDMKGRELLITICWDDSIKLNLERFIEFLNPYFANVKVYIMPDVPEGEGWPVAANWMFYHSMAWLAQNGNKEPVYFFEADNFPIRQNWLRAFDDEYEQAGKPYMGVIQPSHFLNTRTREIFTKETHMVGSGIYPADFMERCKGVHTLDMIAWDVALSEEIIPECHNTNLISHQWNSEKFHFKDGELIGSKRDPSSRFSTPVKGLAIGEVKVNPEALVVHGCKDLSLYSIDFPS